MYNWIVHSLVIIPLLGFLGSLFLHPRNEKAISTLAFAVSGLSALITAFLLVYWLLDGMPVLNSHDMNLYQAGDYIFFVDLFLDKITMVYLFVGSVLLFLIMVYSKYYMHRESGYKRFFNTVLFFYLAYNLTVCSGNFETLFIGWEFLGISSFLLIAFYRDRYLPVRNAVKVFSIYRIGDVGILLAMWASHHFWHGNATFLEMANKPLFQSHLSGHEWEAMLISGMLLLAALAKSAQFPFSSWLPRAMEGPTPSSAIFYGSLSVHFGVFILLRTHPIWDEFEALRWTIGISGLISAVGGTLIARVQSSVKSQIAYSSIAQIGIIFAELALGWYDLALFHFAGNAFLRTYQLLISPSIVSYLIREQFYEFQPHLHAFEDTLPRKIEYTTFVLGLKEWNLENMVNRLFFRPLKKIGNMLGFLSYNNLFYFLIPTYVLGFVLWFYEFHLPREIAAWLPEIFAFIGLTGTLKAFSEKKYPRMAWILVVANHFWIALAVSFNEAYDYHENLFYLTGIAVFGLLGFILLEYLKRREKNFFHLNRYFGHVYEYPKLAGMFLLCGLGVMAFPISTSFIGEDIIFSHIHSNQFFLAFFNSLSYITGGIAIIRMYARLFLGPHCKPYHSISNISS